MCTVCPCYTAILRVRGGAVVKSIEYKDCATEDIVENMVIYIYIIHSVIYGGGRSRRTAKARALSVKEAHNHIVHTPPPNPATLNL